METIKSVLTFRKMFFFYLIMFLTIPLSFFLRIIYADSLSVEEFGILYAIFSFITLSSLFINFGFSTTLMYKIPKLRIKNKINEINSLFYTSILFQLGFFLIFLLFLLIFKSFIVEDYFKNDLIYQILYLIIIYLLSNIFFRTITDLFLCYKLNIYFQIFRFLQLFLILILSVTIIFFKLFNLVVILQIWTGVTISIIIIMFIIILLKIKELRKIPKINIIDSKEFLVESSHNFFNILGLNIISQIDIIFITYFLPIIFVSYYSNAISIILTITGIFTPISLLLIPIFSELKEKNELEKIEKILEIFYSNVLYIILPITIFIFMFAENIILLIFGNDYFNSIEILKIFALFLIFRIYFFFNLSFLNGLSLIKDIKKIIIPIMILNIILNLILIKYFLILGIVFSTIITWILGFIISTRFILKEINFKFDIENIFFIIISNSIFFISIVILKKIKFIENYYINSLLVILISGIIYLIAGYIFEIYSVEKLKEYLLKNN